MSKVQFPDHVPSSTAVLVEPYFGSREADCQAADRHYAALTSAIHRACLAFINGG